MQVLNTNPLSELAYKLCISFILHVITMLLCTLIPYSTVGNNDSVSFSCEFNLNITSFCVVLPNECYENSCFFAPVHLSNCKFEKNAKKKIELVTSWLHGIFFGFQQFPAERISLSQ